MEDPDLNAVIDLFKPRTIKRNTLLLSEGDTCQELFFIYSGSIRTYYITAEGQEKTRYIALDGSVATALASFISRQPSYEFVETIEPCGLLAISYPDFFALMKKYPAWEIFYRMLLEQAYLHQHKRIGNLVTLTAAQRYNMLLAEHPDYVKRISNRILASYLGLSQETLSRLKSKMIY